MKMGRARGLVDLCRIRVMLEVGMGYRETYQGRLVVG